MIIRSRAICGALALASLVPASASAQSAGSPYAGLFGRAPDRTGKEFTAVQFRSTAGAQIGQTLHADFDQVEVVPEGLSGAADASINAEYMRDRVQLLGQGRYAYQEYRQTPAFGAPGFDLGGRANIEATTRLSFQAGGHFLRSPFFHLMWLTPDLFGPTLTSGDGAAMVLLRNDSLEANAGFIAQLSKRSNFTATAFTRETRFEDAPQHDFSTRGGRGQFRHQLNRTFAVRAGYAREELLETTDGLGDNYVNEILDIGVDFAKSLSMGRRTTLGFSTETSMVRENGGSRQLRLNGNIGLEKRFLRTWQAQLAARRATEFIPGFTAPVFTERGRASLAGYLTKRVLFNANGEGGRGEVGIGDAHRFISYNGDATLTFGLTRHLGVFGQYLYYHYQMPPDALALVSAPRLSRQALSIGVRTWVSIIDKEKVPRDPR